MLVFAYRQFRRAGTDDDNGMAWPILHCIDKRTGRDVFKGRFGSVNQSIAVWPKPNWAGEVIIRWPDASIRFRYSR